MTLKLVWILPVTLLFLISCANQVASDSPLASSPVSSITQSSQARIRSGTFVSGEHETKGGVRIFTQNGKVMVELDAAFKTSNLGPDLVVALHLSSNVIAATTPPAYALKEGDYVVLAPLQKFNGMQRYAVPNTVNLTNYQSVVIWCRKFNATFGSAQLN